MHSTHSSYLSSSSSRPWRGGRLIPSPVAPPICIRQAAKMGEKLSGKERGGEKIVVLGGAWQTGRDQINNCTHSHPLSPRLINSLSSLMCQSIHRPVCRRRPRSCGRSNSNSRCTTWASTFRGLHRSRRSGSTTRL